MTSCHLMGQCLVKPSDELPPAADRNKYREPQPHYEESKILWNRYFTFFFPWGFLWNPLRSQGTCPCGRWGSVRATGNTEHQRKALDITLNEAHRTLRLRQRALGLKGSSPVCVPERNKWQLDPFWRKLQLTTMCKWKLSFLSGSLTHRAGSMPSVRRHLKTSSAASLGVLVSGWHAGHLRHLKTLFLTSFYSLVLVSRLVLWVLCIYTWLSGQYSYGISVCAMEWVSFLVLFLLFICPILMC